MATTMPTRAGARLAPFLVYVGVFHLAWIAWPFVVYPRLIALGERTLLYALLNIMIRILVWVVPVFLYLRHVDHVEPLAYLKLTDGFRRAVAVAAIVTALNFLGYMARFGLPHPSAAHLTWNSLLGTSFLVGFIEEIPYRGFMLQKFTDLLGFPWAGLLTSVLFLVVHLPGWLALRVFAWDTAAFVFVFAVLMALLVRYSKSLWASILTHSANDCLSVVVFGR